MVERVRDGIIKVLLDKFGDIEVYNEIIMQDLVKPCFSLQLVSSNETKRLDTRYWLENDFAIYYFNDDLDELYAIQQDLCDCLELINTAENELVRATNKSISVNHSDRVLTLTLSYNFFIKKKKQDTKMEILDVRKEIKYR